MAFLTFFLFLTVHVAAASCFVSLVFEESDNNVKLVVLDRLDSLRAMHGHVLDGLIMDDLYCQLTPSFWLVGTSIMLELQKCGVVAVLSS
jgi:hypothetical protein